LGRGEATDLGAVGGVDLSPFSRSHTVLLLRLYVYILYTNTHTHTHTHACIYISIYILNIESTYRLS